MDKDKAKARAELKRAFQEIVQDFPNQDISVWAYYYIVWNMKRGYRTATFKDLVWLVSEGGWSIEDVLEGFRHGNWKNLTEFADNWFDEEKEKEEYIRFCIMEKIGEEEFAENFPEEFEELKKRGIVGPF